MQLTLLKAKLHKATVTEANLNYTGSITIDKDLLDQSGILVWEKGLRSGYQQWTTVRT